MKKALCVASYLLTLLTPPNLHGQTVDPAFPPLDLRITDPAGWSHLAHDISRDAQGRIMVGGELALANGTRYGKAIRLTAAGVIDPTFNPGGLGANGLVDKVVPLASGQYLICGSFTHYNGQPAGRVARLNADGTLDGSFNAGGTGADDRVAAIASDGQGRILITGYFATFNGQPCGGLLRLTATGAVDASFQLGAGLQYANNSRGLGYDLTFDAQGRILVAGYFDKLDGATTPAVARLLANGARDASFTPALSVNSIGRHVAVATTGEVWVGGQMLDASRSFRGLARLTSTGAELPLLTRVTRTVQGMALQANGQVLISSSTVFLDNQSTNSSVVRLNPDGSRDAAFSAGRAYSTVGATQGNSPVYELEVLPGGSVLIGGPLNLWSTTTGTYTPTGAVARLTSTGTLDLSFAGPDLDINGGVRKLLRQSTGRTVAQVAAQTANGSVLSSGLLRLTPGGQVDPSFQCSTPARTVVLAPGDALVTWDGDAHVQRLLPDGSADPAFSDGTGAALSSFDYTGLFTSLAAQSDGKVLVGGEFDSYSGSPRDGLVRLNSDGTVDQGFLPPADSGRRVSAVAVQPDGRILFVALDPNFTLPDRLLRLNPNGAPDFTFNGGQPLDLMPPFTFSNPILLPLPDNSLLVSAYYLQGLGTPSFTGPVAHLTAAGVFDPNFTADPLTAGILQRQADGRLLVSSNQGTFGGAVRRLNPDGTLDLTFQPVSTGGLFSGETAETALVTASNQVLIGGYFNEVNGANYPSLARLNVPNTPLGLAPDQPAGPASFALDFYPNPAHDHLTLRLPQVTAAGEPATATLRDALGRVVQSWLVSAAETPLALPSLPGGVYSLRVRTASGTAARVLTIQ